ncbi:acyltransferase family protein [Cryptosporangium aurantiacum]|uniref:Peptidoglycan/LPS O-acetylase OafA/YrhL, contains acyltransferase and SGNH-hydrolase domains n=1 Tax=Cryptosporangium aurantiacum TaxID=134849 RepID=A0A1M7RP34_9ACTN|nr:acyltransferase family protein [Cryptosporangium aurantiacum]SHN48063.1 Peptidoglycan/LPS O-acetylase OafA/YrhL, contains acyltransferase and SGNH-hydrolase domains [Cryptosporangium aurantiacum]
MTAAVGTRASVRPRELYLDALRTAAIVRVVVYHSFGGAWLSWAFPAMGVMFALAGGLMVKSLDRQPAATVIRNRVRRLLPALWLFGAVMIPVMIWQGGALSTWSDSDTGDPIPLWHLVFWLVPIFDPPGNEWGENVTVVLWYLRTYLWLVALSPLLLRAFRRWPIPTLLLPLSILFMQALDVVPNADDGMVWALLSDLGIFAPCWMLGFAHRTGGLAKVPIPALATFVVGAAAGGIVWALSHPLETDDGNSYDLNGIPVAQALWSLAVIVPLLRFAPDASWIGRTPVLGRFVALVNARAVTIYLWHNVLIDVSYVLSEKLEEVGGVWESGITYHPAWIFGSTWILIVGAVVLFGWVEDLAARRRPRLFPVGPSAAAQRAARDAEATGPPDGEPAGPPVFSAAEPPGRYGAEPPGRYGAEPAAVYGAETPGVYGAESPGVYGAEQPGHARAGARAPGQYGERDRGYPAQGPPVHQGVGVPVPGHPGAGGPGYPDAAAPGYRGHVPATGGAAAPARHPDGRRGPLPPRGADPMRGAQPPRGGQAPHDGQRLYGGSSDGQAPYDGRPSYDGQPPRGGQPSRDGQPSHGGRSTYGGEPPYAARPTYGGEPPHGGGPSYGGERTYGEPSIGEPSIGEPSYRDPSFGEAPYGEPPYGGEPQYGGRAPNGGAASYGGDAHGGFVPPRERPGPPPQRPEPDPGTSGRHGGRHRAD